MLPSIFSLPGLALKPHQFAIEQLKAFRRLGDEFADEIVHGVSCLRMNRFGCRMVKRLSEA